MIKFPIDLTPGQRAKLKLYSHFAIIAIFNGVLAALVLLGNGSAISWNVVLISAVSQATLALLDGLKKYYSASGELPLSMLLDLARQEVAAKAPPAPAYTQNELAAQQAFNNLISSQQISPPPVSSPVAIAHPIPDNADRFSTIPNIAAITKQIPTDH